MAFGQGLDNPRSSTDPALTTLGDATQGNSQYIYIYVTLAGAKFVVSNGLWVIGDTTVPLPANPWYAWPKNVYHSAGGAKIGEFPPTFITAVGSYVGNFANDCPVIHNQGGVALDFFLVVDDMGGWYYDSKHSSNLLTDLQAATTTTASGAEPFKNAFQLRANFVRWGDLGTTANYNDVAGATRFIFPRIPDYTGMPANPVDHRVANSDLVYTSAFFGNMAAITNTYQYNAATTLAWAEATKWRMNPNAADANDLPRTATAKGLGIPPDGRVTIAMELLTPRTITAAYRTYLDVHKVIRLRLFGTASDALD